jgi:hypothetical protein
MPTDVVTFEEHVLPWLQQHRPEAVTVEKVTTDGSDWEGDTEGGFYSSFGVTIVYLDAAGQQKYLNVDGSDMESLWKHTVGVTADSHTGELAEPPRAPQVVVRVEVATPGGVIGSHQNVLGGNGQMHVETPVTLPDGTQVVVRAVLSYA